MRTYVIRRPKLSIIGFEEWSGTLLTMFTPNGGASCPDDLNQSPASIHLLAPVRMSIRPNVYSRYAGMHVPRYTSYPTAPHFSDAIGEAEYRRWLRDLPDDEPTSIYIHIPFCREMCWYCGCHTTVANRRAPVSRYVSVLAQEIRLVTSELHARHKVNHLHWGGGSPTLLTPGSIKRVSALLHRAFDLEAASEIAIEVDPRTLSEPVVRAFVQARVNRASLGVQSFDPRVQIAINRIQSFETTKDAADALRRNGISRINLDLVYGLPCQTAASCIDTVEQALKLCPERLAIFGYAHVPGFKPHQRKIAETDLPGIDQRQEQFSVMADRLTSAGYARIGLDHFALPDDPLALAARAGTVRRNFQGYTTDTSNTLLGFGASAIGRLQQGYVQNAVRIPDYQRSVQEGRVPVVRGYVLTDEDKRRAAVIEQLMCLYRADAGDLVETVGHLEADGLISRSGTHIEITEEARPLVRAVAAAFDAKLPNSARQHVTAV